MAVPTVPGLRERIPLAPLTTLELGGPARFLLDVEDEGTVEDAVRWAERAGYPLTVIGGGSNLVIADSGVPGLVVRMSIRGFDFVRDGDAARVTVGAAEPWDDVVARAVGHNLAGLECLSGIPGTAGATPIQNVGAYGQEVSEAIDEVRVFDRTSLTRKTLAAVDCGFGYRTSVFRDAPDRYVVLGVVFRLRPEGRPTLRYPDLTRILDASAADPSLPETRVAVLELRRSKSMVIEARDPNRRSVGSFFVNPVLAESELPDVAEAASVADDEVPRFAARDGKVKIPAAWLIESCGFSKGTRRGRVGLSSRHSLALVHHGGGTTGELVDLAREIRSAVRGRFGIDLEPEPRFLGFDVPDPTVP